MLKGNPDIRHKAGEFPYPVRQEHDTKDDQEEPADDHDHTHIFDEFSRVAQESVHGKRRHEKRHRKSE
jgi:hypothetical protein